MSYGTDFRNPGDVSGDDGLATFTLGTGPSMKPSNSNKTPGRWIFPGEVVEVAGHTIIGGYFYCGGSLSAVDRFGSESSLIDESLVVEKKDCTYSDMSLDYYPSYLSISPKCRGAYLDWLESGKNNPNTPLGYVFLYFYGLERRIIHDAKKPGQVSDDEFTSIADELKRLVFIYGGISSFERYAYRLLEWMNLLRPSLVSMTNKEISDNNLRLLFSILAGKLVRDRKCIPADMAFVWLNFTNFIPKTPGRRCPEMFKDMFTYLYREQFGEGMLIKPNKTFVRSTYFPASSSLPQIMLKTTTLPDPTVLGSVASKLIMIANTASHKLDPYSRYLGKMNSTPADIGAILLLPEEISGSGLHNNQFPGFTQWALDAIERKKGLVKFVHFWEELTDKTTYKIDKGVLDIILAVVDRTGLKMAPDPRIHNAKPCAEGYMVLYRNDHSDPNEPSSTFNEVLVTLRLGSMLATTKKSAHELEVTFLKGLIDNNACLFSGEKHSLHAYLLWCLNSPHSTANLKTQVEILTDLAKKEIITTLINLALIDGKVSPDDIKQIEKLYALLGFDKALVMGDLHTITTSRRQGRDSSSANAGFILDADALALHEGETRDAQGLLNDIFSDDEYEDVVDIDTSTAATEIVDDGLDPTHKKLIEQLVKQEVWARNNYESLCEGLGLMPDGALEAINEWSIEQVGDLLLEEDDGNIHIMLDIADEIANN